MEGEDWDSNILLLYHMLSTTLIDGLLELPATWLTMKKSLAPKNIRFVSFLISWISFVVGFGASSSVSYWIEEPWTMYSWRCISLSQRIYLCGRLHGKYHSVSYAILFFIETKDWFELGGGTIANGRGEFYVYHLLFYSFCAYLWLDFWFLYGWYPWYKDFPWFW